MSVRPNEKKSARACVPLLGILILSIGQFSRAADMPPRPNLPALPDQKEWDAAIAKFSKDPDPRLAANLAMVFEVQLPDPADGSKAYSYKPTTIFRIENGQIAEHWGGGPKGSL